VLEVIARSLLFASLAAVAFIPLERIFGARAATRRNFATDIAFATLGQALTRVGALLVMGVALAGIDAVAVERALGSGIDSPDLRALVQLGAGLLAFELGGYAYHRLAHHAPWLWRLHRVHHSSRDMDWLAAFRQHPLEILLMTLFQNAPLVLLGIPFGPHATVAALLRLHTVFLHSNLRLPHGWWDELMAMPRFHQRHHARRGAPINFASLLPALDRAFGTHSRGEAREFGVDEPMPERFGQLLLHPFARSDDR